MGRIVSNVMQWSSVRIAQDDLIWKPPGQPNTTVGFHQDGAYISDQFEPRENNSVTVWMALDDATVENGCVEYAVGSHRWVGHHGYVLGVIRILILRLRGDKPYILNPPSTLPTSQPTKLEYHQMP